MAATVRGAFGALTSTAVTSFTVTETAASPQAGDVRYLFVNTASSTNIVVTPQSSGWATVLSTVAVGSGNLAVFSKPWVAGVGTETFTLSGSGGAYCSELVAVTGVDQAATPTVATNGATSGTALTTATVTPTVSSGLLLAYFSETVSTTASSATLSVPAGMTDVDHVTAATTGQGYAARISSLAITSTAAVGPFTSTANQSGSWRTAAAVIPALSTTAPTAGNFLPYLGLGTGMSR